MHTRSINLKMVLDRSEDGRQLRCDLWTTHYEINKAAAYMETRLLWMRGRSYITENYEQIDERYVCELALKMARDAQQKNTGETLGSDDEVLSVMRGIYEAIVPSVRLDENGKPKKGKAKESRAFAGPLMMASSRGFQVVLEKIVKQLPEWVSQMKANDSKWSDASNEWLKSDEAQRLLKSTGRPSGWIKALKKGKDWQKLFVDDQEKKRKDPVPLLIKKAKDLRLLPLFSPPIKQQLNVDDLTRWDRLSLRLAVGHLLSWETWNHKTASKHAYLVSQVTALQARLNGFEADVSLVRQYESSRHSRLTQVALASEEAPFVINRRMLRGLKTVLEKWQRCSGYDDRIKVLANLQAKLRGKFGDPDFFRWLAQDRNLSLHSRGDLIQLVAKANDAGKLLRRTRIAARHTLPDARLHPTWLNYEAKGGTNLHKYQLVEKKGSLTLSLPLLTRRDGVLAESREHCFAIAPSKQFGDVALKSRAKKAIIRFRMSHQEMSATLEASDILFRRSFLENHTEQELQGGRIGPCWLKLVLDIDSQAPKEWLDGEGQVKRPSSLKFLNSASNVSAGQDDVLPGLRVLAVDLGIRSFAACSVFEIVDKKPEKSLAFQLQTSSELWAKHERSFLLSLPGDSCSQSVKSARDIAYQEIQTFRGYLRMLRDLVRLSATDDSIERGLEVEDIEAAVALFKDTATLLPTLQDITQLRRTTSLSQEQWTQAVLTCHRTIEARISNEFAAWRTRTRKRSLSRRNYAPGKSDWSIQYLTNVRRLLLSWRLRGREYRQINRADQAAHGVFGASLLTHINKLKEDRIKTGTDLIVQAARGFVPFSPKGWMCRYKPCQVILFEDLARYRFRTDRPRRENAMLMRWSHREVIRKAEMQSELYGITTTTNAAGFTSRFHAVSAAPGCRTRLLKKSDFMAEDGSFIRMVAELLRVDESKLKPGLRIPWQGGEDFTTFDSRGSLVTVHADINASQNLQRRLWTRNSDAYRIKAKELRSDQSTVWVITSTSKRVKAALSRLLKSRRKLCLTKAEDEGYYLAELGEDLNAQEEIVSAGETGDSENLGLLSDLLNEDHSETSANEQIFFRDPSGYTLRRDRWYEAKEFWARVESRLWKSMRESQLGS